MASIGIIANPASGKDIRRLVSYATTIDNNEKVNICKRIVLAAQGLGVDEALFMPDTFMIGYAVKDSLEDDGVLEATLGLLDFELEATMEDTVLATRLMVERGVGCVVVLGGDGTSRARGKSNRRYAHAEHFNRYKQRLPSYDGRYSGRHGRSCGGTD